MEVIAVGLDLTKDAFQVHGSDGSDREKLRRDQMLIFFR